MKRIALGCVFLWGAALHCSAMAAGVHYVLPKIGAMVFDASPEIDKPLFTLGAFYGYGVSSYLAIELEGNYGVYGGEYQASGKTGRFTGWDIGAYGVFRYPYTVSTYLKAKTGGVLLGYEHKRASTGATEKINDPQVVLGAGIGHVFRNDITLELEYTRIKATAHVLALGIHYPLDF